MGPEPGLNVSSDYRPEMRRPRSRSRMASLRRFETSLKRLKCVNTGHSDTA